MLYKLKYLNEYKKFIKWKVQVAYFSFFILCFVNTENEIIKFWKDYFMHSSSLANTSSKTIFVFS